MFSHSHSHSTNKLPVMFFFELLDSNQNWSWWDETTLQPLTGGLDDDDDDNDMCNWGG